MRSINSSGVGYGLFLRARGGGWGIDLQERLKIANPGGMPGGYCYQSN